MRKYDKGDALPEDYKTALLNLMSFQADSEYAGGQRVAENAKYAPRPEEAYRLAKKVMEEMGHGYYVWNLMADLGVDVDARLHELVTHPDNPDPKKVNVINGFRKENWAPMFDSWYDVALFSTLVTPAAVAFLGQYRDCSYLPWAQVNVRIHKEEFGHLAFGVWAAKRCVEFDGDRGVEELQKRVPKFMKMGLGFYGRPSKGDGKSKMFDIYYEYGLKTKSPEELQTEYWELVHPRLKEVGLVMPPESEIEPDYDMRVGYDAGDHAAA
jgi:ring-1,2-phenylacetyl-CoA epoxidase subunit PaaA